MLARSRFESDSEYLRRLEDERARLEIELRNRYGDAAFDRFNDSDEGPASDEYIERAEAEGA